MSEYVLTDIENLKIVYQEIIKGYSPTPEGYYVRHFNELDQIQVLRKKISIFNHYIAQGIPAEADKIKSLILNEEWSAAQEEKILELKYNISDNERNIANIVIQQHATVRHMIELKKKELAALLIQRQELLGLTADTASEKEVYHYIACLSLFQDKLCSAPLFKSFDDFENLDDDEIEKYINIVELALTPFKEQTVRRISVMPFFLNPFSYSKDTIHTFVEIPISQLTNYQILLFSLGTRNINILSQAEGEPPELLDDITPQKVLDWYDQQYSIILGKRKTSK